MMRASSYACQSAAQPAPLGLRTLAFASQALMLDAQMQAQEAVDHGEQDDGTPVFGIFRPPF
eukprot:15836016-Heterocapsa_arctica.AAC.1